MCKCKYVYTHTYLHTHIKSNYNEGRWLYVKDMQGDTFPLLFPSGRCLGKPSQMEEKAQNEILLAYI